MGSDWKALVRAALVKKKVETHEQVEGALGEIFGEAFTGLDFEDRADYVQVAWSDLQSFAAAEAAKPATE